MKDDEIDALSHEEVMRALLAELARDSLRRLVSGDLSDSQRQVAMRLIQYERARTAQEETDPLRRLGVPKSGDVAVPFDGDAALDDLTGEYDEPPGQTG